MSFVSGTQEQATARFPKLENEFTFSHLNHIISCLLAHCPFDRFFLPSPPLYSSGHQN